MLEQEETERYTPAVGFNLKALFWRAPLQLDVIYESDRERSTRASSLQRSIDGSISMASARSTTGGDKRNSTASVVSPTPPLSGSGQGEGFTQARRRSDGLVTTDR